MEDQTFIDFNRIKKEAFKPLYHALLNDNCL